MRLLDLFSCAGGAGMGYHRAGFEVLRLHLRNTGLEELRADYVETFDTRRRHNLFLTYFVHGDTRQRGMALLRFQETFQAAGVDLDPGEQQRFPGRGHHQRPRVLGAKVVV